MQITLILIIVGILLTQVICGLSLAPWVPTRKRDFERISKMAKLKPGMVFCELGSGDTRVCRYLAKRHPHADIIGIELNPLLYFLGKLKQWLNPLPNLKLIRGNVFEQDLRQADVIYVFGMIKSINERLIKKITTEQNKPQLLLSYSFRVKDMKPSFEDTGAKHKITLLGYNLQPAT
jgi:16S rRNA A1518/A1519 N6-dimethyltransferase RsmA/KsgA/DIM1 with predicted DNA glycosylase/AP lyase activity